MSSTILNIMDDLRQQALQQAQRLQISRELQELPITVDYELIQRAAQLLEIAVLELVSERQPEYESKLKLVAADAFRLFRVVPRPDDALDTGIMLLRAGALAVLGDMGFDAARWLRENSWPELPLESHNWKERTWATVVDVWLRLFRKDGWNDRDLVLTRISSLREVQLTFEKEYLQRLDISNAKAGALELMGLYHLAKAAEIFAHYMTDGVVNGKYQIQELLDSHFDQVLAVGRLAKMIELEPLSLLLSASATRLAENSMSITT